MAVLLVSKWFRVIFSLRGNISVLRPIDTKLWEPDHIHSTTTAATAPAGRSPTANKCVIHSRRLSLSKGRPLLSPLLPSVKPGLPLLCTLSIYQPPSLQDCISLGQGMHHTRCGHFVLNSAEMLFNTWTPQFWEMKRMVKIFPVKYKTNIKREKTKRDGFRHYWVVQRTWGGTKVNTAAKIPGQLLLY